MAVTEHIDITPIDAIVAERGTTQASLISILQGIQEHYKYLPQPALERVCAITEITPAALESVATFFSQFRRTPVGRHMISVCDGTACHVKGAPAVYDALARHLDIEDGEDTDPDGEFTIRKVACLGCCTLAPAVQIDGTTYGHVRTDTVGHMVRDFLENEANARAREAGRTKGRSEDVGEIRVGLGSCCIASGSEKIRQVIEDSLVAIDSPVPVKRVGCVGMCHQTPLLEVVPPGEEKPHLYAKVQPDDVPAIINKHFKSHNPLLRLKTAAKQAVNALYTNEGHDAVERYALDVRDKQVHAFLGAQRHLATEYCGEIDPVDLDEYKRKGGFRALEQALSMSPDEIVETIRNCGLRGRGGAGFPSAVKWTAVQEAEGDTKYIICNGDEGDPGAFMDRMILESYPYRVIEGMAIASKALGVHEGWLYIRAEYPLAVKRVREALAFCENAGLLGDNILGSDHSLRLEVMEGAGAFVCGEETALIASMEGRRGTPTFRPPYPAQKGLHGCPTLVNNTESFSLIPWIINNGPNVFAEMGTAKSKGTKVFSLAGKINRGGLIEVPMGMTIRQIVEDIGGGIEHGKKLKAVQVGGPSGGCIPAELADTAVDYEALTGVGAMMGSGGFVVLDEDDCMVEMARYFLSFTQEESCGKCPPCRVGTKRMLEMLTNFCEGTAQPGDIEKLEHLAHTVKTQSLCGLGKTAPNPILTSLRYFRDEFEAHLEGHCPSGKCPALITYSITDDCIGCTKCAQGCPVDAIPMTPYEVHTIDSDICIRCDACRQVCPVDAVKVS